MYADKLNVDGVAASYLLSHCDRNGLLHINSILLADSVSTIARHLKNIQFKQLFTDIALLKHLPTALLSVSSAYEDSDLGSDEMEAFFSDLYHKVLIETESAYLTLLHQME